MKINNNGVVGENNMTFCCPVCKNALTKNEKLIPVIKSIPTILLKVEYVNLLLPNQMNTKLTVTINMVQARTNF